MFSLISLYFLGEGKNASLLFVLVLCKLMNLHLKLSTTRVCGEALKRLLYRDLLVYIHHVN